MADVRVIEGDCLEEMAGLPSGSVDAVITDPPYPCIKRSYGYWTEEEWWALMRPCVRECMRVLKPSGSAVFILQPNSERDGRLRTWLWEFLLWVGKEWGVVQDAYWWNTCPLPSGNGVHRDVGLMRPSVKACVWVGLPDCYRNQDAVLLPLTKTSVRHRDAADVVTTFPSGRSGNLRQMARTAMDRGGATPMNLLPFGNDGYAKTRPRGETKHAAATPLALLRWWTRYICPPGGTVLDPFGGSGTTGIAALREGRSAILVEKESAYVEIIHKRLAVERDACLLFP